MVCMCVCEGYFNILNCLGMDHQCNRQTTDMLEAKAMLHYAARQKKQAAKNTKTVIRNRKMAKMKCNIPDYPLGSAIKHLCSCDAS